jgi:hypothetical protein
VSIGRELEPGAGLKASLAHNIKLQAAFEKAALQKSNNLTLLAGPAIDFLRNEDQVLSNFYDTAKPLMRQPVLDMANIKSEDDLEKRKTLLLQYLDASGCASNYYRNVENDFHAMAIKGGLPDATVEKQTKRLRTNLNKMSQLPAIWETNDRWARSELRALGFLGSNWQSWSYDVSLRKTVFKDEKVRTEFNRMVAEINTVDRQRKQLQQQLQQNLQQNPIR